MPVSVDMNDFTMVSMVDTRTTPSSSRQILADHYWNGFTLILNIFKSPVYIPRIE